MAEGIVLPAEEPTALEALNRSEIDIQITTAKKFPRVLSRVLDEAKSLATLNAEIAESMGYALIRGKGSDRKVIKGPSIRCAEIVGSTWGNLRYGSRVIEVGANFVTAQGVCHDLEKNVAITCEVRRRITTKEGRRFSDDMIGVTSNAACSVALRNAIFKVVPFSLVQDVYDQAIRVATGGARGLIERRQRALSYFTETLGIDLPRVLAALDRPDIDSITLEDLSILQGLKTSIKDGDTTIEEAFPEPQRFAPVSQGNKQPQPDIQQGPKNETPQTEEAQTAETRGRRRMVGWPNTDLKTAGISPQSIQKITDCTLPEPEKSDTIKAFFETALLPDTQHELTFLNEHEAVKLLKILEAKEPQQEGHIATTSGEPLIHCEDGQAKGDDVTMAYCEDACKSHCSNYHKSKARQATQSLFDGNK